MAKSKPEDRSFAVVLDPGEVMSRTGLDRDAIVAGVHAGTFPRPHLLEGKVVWNEPEVRDWIAANVPQRAKRAEALSPAILKLIDAIAEELVNKHLDEQRGSDSK